MTAPFLIRPPKFYKWLFPEALFRMDSKSNQIYLTFDDGPHPEATRHALQVLKKHRVKATFFMLGKNAAQFPEMVAQVRADGHCVANHGMDHLSGWSTPKAAYVEDIKRGKTSSGSDIFRPPYGRLTFAQYRELKKTERIVFWDVLSGDFDPDLDPDRVVNNVIDRTRNGSVIVMHDSKKAFPNLLGSLDRIITILTKKGYTFGTL